MMRSQDVANEIAVGAGSSQRRTCFVMLGLTQRVEVPIPTKSQVECQAGFDAPVILHKQPQIVVVDKRSGRRTNRRAALESYGNRNVRVIAASGSRTRRAREEILSGEVPGHEKTSAAEKVKEYVGSVILVFSPEPQAMLAQGPVEGVPHLVAG